MPRCQIDGDCSVQVPGYPYGDGNCSAPACDVGAVPVGEYVFDPRAWNVSVRGQTLGQWWVDEYLFGPTGAGDPVITGFYFDDVFSAALRPRSAAWLLSSSLQPAAEKTSSK
jgi:hypothetical protein